MFSMGGSSNMSACAGVPLPTTPMVQATIAPAVNSSLPVGSVACYSAPNDFTPICCSQQNGQLYDWCGWATCVVKDQSAFKSCLASRNNGTRLTDKCSQPSSAGRRAPRGWFTLGVVALALATVF